MEKNGKLKLLALLVLIMMIVVLPITAFAEGEEMVETDRQTIKSD